MADIIQLLPDHVANQIAAGEVVQRPASVVKELMENAIDAGATLVNVVIRDSGKTLVQVIDNGSGMSETDARMSFERHATSKIRKTEDLFHIHTKGFRGEALASIAAVAQVELRTRLTDAQMGTSLRIEGSKVKSQEPDACPPGTNFQVKNLFFNVPARRYFLKSDQIEFRHIIDEFQRIALTHPDISFILSHNGNELFNLHPSSLRQRIVHVFGPKYNEKLVPVDEQTDIVGVTGFAGKPDMARKSRGDQFFFINNRFIRNSYLHHAVMSAFEGLIPAGSYPLYLIYLSIDPAQIDVNIHPTKTEVKFQDERAIYAILHAAVKRALGRHNIAPTLDFEQETAMSVSPLTSTTQVRPPQVHVNPSFNPFGSAPAQKEKVLQNWFEGRRETAATGWQQLHEIQRDLEERTRPAEHEDQYLIPEFPDDAAVLQIERKYIAVSVKSGLLLVDQQRAHERILFEQYLKQVQTGEGLSQQLLFPEMLPFSAQDRVLLSEREHELAALGFDLVIHEDGNVELRGVPPEVPGTDARSLLEMLVERIRTDVESPGEVMQQQLSWLLAAGSSVRHGQMLTTPEMRDLLNRLKLCREPSFTYQKKPVMITLSQPFIDRQFS